MNTTKEYGVDRSAPLTLNVGFRWMLVVRFTRQQFYTLGMGPSTEGIRVWVDTTASLETLEKNKLSRPAASRLLNIIRAPALNGSAAAVSILDNVKRPKNVSKMVVQDSLY
jgi:hypothetical protein